PREQDRRSGIIGVVHNLRDAVDAVVESIVKAVHEYKDAIAAFCNCGAGRFLEGTGVAIKSHALGSEIPGRIAWRAALCALDRADLVNLGYGDVHARKTGRERTVTVKDLARLILGAPPRSRNKDLVRRCNRRLRRFDCSLVQKDVAFRAGTAASKHCRQDDESGCLLHGRSLLSAVIASA